MEREKIIAESKNKKTTTKNTTKKSMTNKMSDLFGRSKSKK